MKLVRCDKGHYYDAERFGVCPHCSTDAAPGPVAPPVENGYPEYPMQPDPTKAYQPAAPAAEPVPAPAAEPVAESTEVTREPVVGWLVAITGPHRGEDFRLKAGPNYIGRFANMDVALTKDRYVSRDKHAILYYDPASLTYSIQTGDDQKKMLVNNIAVYAPQAIGYGDALTIGHTDLLFFPCCSESFNWNIV